MRDLPLADLSTILWAGNGVQRDVDAVSSASKPMRTIPYSGDLAYLKEYLLNEKGVFFYDAEKNLLKQVSAKDSRASILPMGIPNNVCMILFVGETASMPDRAKQSPIMERVMHATAGFAAQNISVVAESLGLDSLVAYSINPWKTISAAVLSSGQLPLFVLQLGYRR